MSSPTEQAPGRHGDKSRPPLQTEAGSQCVLACCEQRNALCCPPIASDPQGRVSFRLNVKRCGNELWGRSLLVECFISRLCCRHVLCRGVHLLCADTNINVEELILCSLPEPHTSVSSFALCRFHIPFISLSAHFISHSLFLAQPPLLFYHDSLLLSQSHFL
ncbi:hypothetical protein CesoFtcFv8_025358 [Champsocephalus esox]|uniref:Uncharacterized protein n=1 Tax=Champsocephalus esox TaxID=159716 RepID=A0AAN8GEY5_9TELE|nr:hypothetical protein CesoFtcFv8_025358 [Champsocephalus esox]